MVGTICITLSVARIIDFSFVDPVTIKTDAEAKTHVLVSNRSFVHYE